MAHFDYLLRLADSPLILGQRLSALLGHGPVLEEDIALANVTLDLLGQARELLALAGLVEGRGRDEDALAFLREEREFRNVTLVELPNGDFARVMVRNLLFCARQELLWEALCQSADATLAAVSVRALGASRYHRRHAADWVVRLGDGTPESHHRSQTALDELWPYARELFDDDAVEREAAADGTGVLMASLESRWQSAVRAVLAEATLTVPSDTAFLPRGTRGRHSEHMGHLLAEMQYLQRAYPGGSW